jgi:hypothetical protein
MASSLETVSLSIWKVVKSDIFPLSICIAYLSTTVYILQDYY